MLAGIMQVLVTVLPYLIGLALAAVLVTLLAGLFTMSKGGDFNRRYGNKLMRLRVGLQGVALLLLLAYMLVTRL